jgi:hypothetical protein
MPWGSVKITRPLRRKIYTNGNYDEAAGLSPGPFAIEYGRNTFETLDGAGRVDYRGSTTINASNRNAQLELDTV